MRRAGENTEESRESGGIKRKEHPRAEGTRWHHRPTRLGSLSNGRIKYRVAWGMLGKYFNNLCCHHLDTNTECDLLSRRITYSLFFRPRYLWTTKVLPDIGPLQDVCQPSEGYLPVHRQRPEWIPGWRRAQVSYVLSISTCTDGDGVYGGCPMFAPYFLHGQPWHWTFIWTSLKRVNCPPFYAHGALNVALKTGYKGRNNKTLKNRCLALVSMATESSTP